MTIIPLMNNERRKALHDALRELAPEGAECPKPCVFCDTTINEERDTMTDTAKDPGYSQDQHDALVAKAVKDAVDPLNAKLADLQGEKAVADVTEAIDKAIADATEPLNTKVAGLEKQAEDAAIAQKAAEDERDALKQFIEDEATKRVIEARKDVRLTEVKDLKVHPEGYWDDEARMARLADMDDEIYADQLAEYQAIAASKPKGNGALPEPGKRSALTDALETGEGTKPSAIRALLEHSVGGARTAASADN